MKTQVLPAADAKLAMKKSQGSAQFPFNALALASLAGAVLASGAVSAQDAADTADSGTELQEIHITGSRVARTANDAPTPVTTIGQDQIKAQAPANIADFVNTLPSVRGSSTAANSAGALSNGAAGISALNLRSLGTGRTLVLFDGQRSVVSATTGLVDTNTFPQSLIERIEIATGGASSAYGSDAVGGVVNFILNRDYTGFETTLDYGSTTHGDAGNWKYTLTAGAPFAERGHVLFSGEVSKTNGIFDAVRDWNKNGYFAMRNPNTSAGAPFYIVGENIGISTYTPGGLITAGPLKGTYFGVNGTVNQLAYGPSSGQWMQGGDWQYTTSGILGSNSLQSEDKRKSVFTRASYELVPGLEAFVQASYARYEGLSYYISPTTTGITITRDNAFLPASVRQRMIDNGNLNSFSMGTSNEDMPASGSANERGTQRYVAGVKGRFALIGKDIAWDGYYQKGITDVDEQLTPTYNVARLALATDAVFDSTGNIVCRSTRDVDPNNGCVPLNRFGVGVASQAALDYVLGSPLRTQKFQQDVVAINFNTNDFKGWAGPIAIAFGAEYRKEQVGGEVDPQFTTGWKYGNYRVTSGDYNVKEAYVEMELPIVQSLNFNTAFRHTDYSTSGGVNTWKAGFTYQPIEDVLFRASKSRDIRAPNLSELYDAGTARTNNVIINGQSVSFVQNLQGSTRVKPEEADTWGAGVVLQPRFAPGLSVSADYYEIDLDGVISFVTAQGVADYCYLFNVQSYCGQLQFQGNTLQTIDLFYDNLNSMKARGLDLEVSYRKDLADVFDGGLGTLSVGGLATHYLENVTDDGVTAIDLAGSNIQNTPDWVYRLTASFNLEPWTFFAAARGVSSGVISNAYTECTSNCPTLVAPYFTVNDNSIPGELYVDASITRGFTIANTMKSEAFLSVTNLFDTDPVLTANPGNLGAENVPGYPQTTRNLYDVLGRTYRVGVRLDW
jgi:iron complex outermembrane recepter protein